MIRTRLMAVAAAAGLLLSASAFAQQAFTSRPGNVRAGPARDFPLVATLAPGTPLDVYGCIEGYTWCDVGFGVGRGWLSTRSMQTAYGGSYVPFYSYAPSVGLPIVGFSLFNYWDRWYRDRPFYRERPRWEARWRDYDHGRIYARPRQEYVPRQDFRAQPREDWRRQQFEAQRRQQFEAQRQQQFEAQRRQQFEAQRQQQLAQPNINREQRFPQRAQQQIQPPRERNPEPRLQSRNLGGGPTDPGREHQGQ